MLPTVMAVVIVLLDQVSKDIVQSHLELHAAITVLPGLFNIRLVTNTGAAWGLFRGGSFWLSIVSTVVLVLLVTCRRALLSDSRLDRVILALLAGGIAGNLIDRVRLGYVVDFLDFHWRTSHFPAFNVADAAICTGVGLYILSQYLQSRRPGVADRPAAPGGTR